MAITFLTSSMVASRRAPECIPHSPGKQLAGEGSPSMESLAPTADLTNGDLRRRAMTTMNDAYVCPSWIRADLTVSLRHLSHRITTRRASKHKQAVTIEFQAQFALLHDYCPTPAEHTVEIQTRLPNSLTQVQCLVLSSSSWFLRMRFIISH